MKKLFTILWLFVCCNCIAQTQYFNDVKVTDDLFVDSVFGYNNGNVYIQGLSADTLNIDTANITALKGTRVYISNPLDSNVTAVIDSNGLIRPSSNPYCAPCIWSKRDSLVYLTDSTDNVGIGTTNPIAAIDVIDERYRFNTDSVYYFNKSDFTGNVSGIAGSDVSDGVIGLIENEALGSYYYAPIIYSNNGFEQFYLQNGANTKISVANIGVDTSVLKITPTIFEFNNQLRIADGTQANGYVLTSNASGNATWQPKLALDSINCYLGTGWVSIFDNTTSYTIAANDTQTILIAQDVVVDQQTPCGWTADSFYSSVDSVILGREGDAYIISLDWETTQNTNNATEFKWWIDIGGAVGRIYPTTYEQSKGIGVTKSYNKTTWVYTLDTWQANGGKIQFTTNQSIDIDNVRINVQRLYKAP